MNRFTDGRVKTLISLAESSGVDTSVFSLPMSANARKLLSSMLVWLSKVNNDDRIKALKEFLVGFDQIKYEDAVHRFRLDSYPGEAKCKLPGFSGKSKSNYLPEILSYLRLENLNNRSWVEENCISLNGNRVGLATSESSRQVYMWLVTNFVLIDFSEFDANKIFELGSGQFDIETIKQAAQSIKDQDKRNISYLYAIVRDVALKNSVIKERTKIIEDMQREKLQKIFSYNEANGPPAKVDDKSDEWARAQEYLDAMRDFKK